ncbi:MAG: ubiquinone/menaquinone biosynthesis methyltransferase [Bacteroidales bacterium]|nr:ubiquinone/menaquinone biosynthesis methyltransferase [Bacteroidales bacterium]
MTFPLAEFYKKIYKRYDLVNTLFTFGLDKKWREKTAKEVIKDNSAEILDLCCGTGKLTFKLSGLLGNKKKIRGYDFSKEMLDIARQEAASKNLTNIEFVQGDVAQMPFNDNEIDVIGITFGFRNLTYNNNHENKHISEILRVLKPGGKLVILESGSPANVLIRFFYVLYLFMFLVPLGFVITGNFKAYFYLALSSRKYYTRQQMKLLLKSFGFSMIKVEKFMLGATNLFVAEKPLNHNDIGEPGNQE